MDAMDLGSGLNVSTDRAPAGCAFEGHKNGIILVLKRSVFMAAR